MPIELLSAMKAPLLLVKIRPIATHRMLPKQIQFFVMWQGYIFHNFLLIRFSGLRICFDIRVSEFGFVRRRYYASLLQCPSRQQFDKPAEHFVSILAIEGQRQLSRQQTVFDTDVITVPFEFTSQITLTLGQLCQRG
jgi:hypothetical protein